MWALAFKAETGSVREAPSGMRMADMLLPGARMRIRDPMAMRSAHAVLADRLDANDVALPTLESNTDEAPIGADLLALGIECQE